MLRRLRQLSHRPKIRMGSIDNSRIHVTPTKNAQFVSFLVDSGFRQVNADRYEVSLRRRRALRGALLVMLGTGGAWVLIESAKALSSF